MRLRNGPREIVCGYRSTVCHCIQAKNRMRHTVPADSLRRTYSSDSRISYKEYKLSDCIDRALTRTIPLPLSAAAAASNSRPQPALHILLQALQPRGIQTLGNIDRLADRNRDARAGLGNHEAIPFDLPSARGRSSSMGSWAAPTSCASSTAPGLNFQGGPRGPSGVMAGEMPPAPAPDNSRAARARRCAWRSRESLRRPGCERSSRRFPRRPTARSGNPA